MPVVTSCVITAEPVNRIHSRVQFFVLFYLHDTFDYYATGGGARSGILKDQNQNCLLVTRQTDNHSPGPGPGRLVPSSNH